MEKCPNCRFASLQLGRLSRYELVFDVEAIARVVIVQKCSKLLICLFARRLLPMFYLEVTTQDFCALFTLRVGF